MSARKEKDPRPRPGIGKAAVRFLAFRVLGRRLGGSAGAFVWSGEWPGAAAWRDHGELDGARPVMSPSAVGLPLWKYTL